MYKAVFAAFCAFYVGRGSFQPLFFVMKSLRIFCQYSFWLTQCKGRNFFGKVSRQSPWVSLFVRKAGGGQLITELINLTTFFRDQVPSSENQLYDMYFWAA